MQLPYEFENFSSPNAFVGALGAVLNEIASNSWEQWSLLYVRLSEAGTEVLIGVAHPRIVDGTVLEYPVEVPLTSEQLQFCVMWVEPLLDSASDPMSKAHGSPPRITF